MFSPGHSPAHPQSIVEPHLHFSLQRFLRKMSRMLEVISPNLKRHQFSSTVQQGRNRISCNSGNGFPGNVFYFRGDGASSRQWTSSAIVNTVGSPRCDLVFRAVKHGTVSWLTSRSHPSIHLTTQRVSSIFYAGTERSSNQESLQDCCWRARDQSLTGHVGEGEKCFLVPSRITRICTAR